MQKDLEHLSRMIHIGWQIINLDINMNRVTRQMLSHISTINKNIVEKMLSKLCRREVNIGATGTQKYRLKKGPNKGKVLDATK
jgi:2C-methyl-D-erythritol 2,4-cyclodiphosphate synthase